MLNRPGFFTRTGTAFDGTRFVQIKRDLRPDPLADIWPEDGEYRLTVHAPFTTLHSPDRDWLMQAACDILATGDPEGYLPF